MLPPTSTSTATPLRPRAALLAAAALIGLGLPVLTASAAAAHSSLLSSDPTEGAVLPTAPAEVTLVFDEGVAPQFADGALTIGDGGAAPLTATAEGAEVVLAVPAGATSSGAGLPWKVDYRVVSSDGHPISGSVNFHVSAAATTPAEASTADGASDAVDTPGAAEPPSGSTTLQADEGPSAASQDDGGGVSTFALAIGLAAVGGAIAGVAVVVLRRRRVRP